MRIAWLDTIRVLAAFLVILSHFAYKAVEIPSVQNFISNYVLFIGQFGNMIFFAVSGYLAANSIAHSQSIKEFYRRKIIRITVPYTFAYIILCIVLLFLGILEPKLISPLKFAVDSGSYSGFAGLFLGMTPIASDANLIKFFHIPIIHLVGEWFIGTVIYLYLLSHLLFRLINRNVILTFISSTIIAWLVYNFSPAWKEAGYIFEGLFLFPIWIPSFLIGMIIFLYQDFFLNNMKKLTLITALLLTGLIFYGGYFNVENQSIWAKLIFGSPSNFWQYLFANIVTVSLVYIVSIFLNEKFDKAMSKFNRLSNISYVAMLIQSAVIAPFFILFDCSAFDKFEVMIFFVSIVLSVIFISEIIRKIYKPIEEKLIRKEAISLGG